MTHPLDEPIPGAPYLEKSEDLNPSLDRLAEAYQTFERHTGALFPHFSYGALSKAEYTLAHTMHFNNHLTQIQRFR
ncbi:MAG: DUF1569 domain-containing protein [Cyanobacteria bacterium RI_101]|nr:DUF1569 domain-containing protein [Cyanobacteria bacterium RI_101]